MKKIRLLKISDLFKTGLLTALLTLIGFAGSAFTVNVQTSASAGINGATVYFSPTSTFSSYTTSTTNGSGVATSPGAGPYYVRVAYNNTTATTPSATGSDVTFYTTQVNVHVLKSDGTTPINGVPAYFATSGGFTTYVVANTASGVATKEMFPGTWHFKATVNNTSSADQPTAVPLAVFATT